MTRLTVWFNGHDITDYLVVTSLDRGIGTTRVNNIVKVGNADGKHYTSVTLDEKIIPMGFFLRHDLITKRRELAGIFNVSEPARLIFSDEPDKYYMATPEGDTDVDDQKFYGNGKINWLVPDGVAHALELKKFTNVTEGPIAIVSDFKNKIAGSVAANPNICKWSASNKIQDPSSLNTIEISNANYINMDTLDGKNNTVAINGMVGNEGRIAHLVISWNILEIVTRKYPELKGITITELKKMWVKAQGNIWAKGSGPNGNKVTSKVWHVPQAAYVEERTNLTADISKLSTDLNTTNTLTNDGFINFIVYADPSNGTIVSSVSIDYASIEISLALPNKKTVTIKSDGTYRSYPILEATMKGDNGVIAFINKNGKVLQFGNPEAIDGYTFKRSDIVIVDKMLPASAVNWTVNVGVINNPYYISVKNKIQGSWDWNVNYDGATPIFLSNGDHCWGGPTLYRKIPKNSNDANDLNFESRTRLRFKNPSAGQTARMEINLLSENGSNTVIPFSVTVCDQSVTKREISLEFWSFGERLLNVPMDLSKFNGDNFEVVIRRQADAATVILRQVQSLDNKENVVASAVYQQSFTLPKVLKVPITATTLWSGNFSNQVNATMIFADFQFWWINVDKWADIPNLFSDGDVFTVDTESGRTFLNGAEVLGVGDIGNMYDGFVIDEKETFIMCEASTWAEMYDLSVYLREAYL